VIETLQEIYPILGNLFFWFLDHAIPEGWRSKPIESHTWFPSSRDGHPFTSYFDAYHGNIHGTTVLTDSRNLMVGVPEYPQINTFIIKISPWISDHFWAYWPISDIAESKHDQLSSPLRLHLWEGTSWACGAWSSHWKMMTTLRTRRKRWLPLGLQLVGEVLTHIYHQTIRGLLGILCILYLIQPQLAVLLDDLVSNDVSRGKLAPDSRSHCIIIYDIT
jgi:hypothetical protein